MDTRKVRRKLTGRKSRKKSINDKAILKAWSAFVKSRAGYTCEMCGKTEGQMHAHHMISKTFRKWRYDVHNGMCLCAACHQWNRKRSAHFSMDATWTFIFWLVDKQPEKFKWFIEKLEEREFGYKHTSEELAAIYKELNQ